MRKVIRLVVVVAIVIVIVIVIIAAAAAAAVVVVSGHVALHAIDMFCHYVTKHASSEHM
jgi:hypothetical protein